MSDYIPCPYCKDRPLCWTTLEWGVRVMQCDICGHTQDIPYSREDRLLALEALLFAVAELITDATFSVSCQSTTRPQTKTFYPSLSAAWELLNEHEFVLVVRGEVETYD